MSRGLGALQRTLLASIRRHGKPMTFEDIRIEAIGDDDVQLSASFERSVRRALHRMVSTGMLVALGAGGRSDPSRYFLHPMGIAIMCDEPEAEALWKALGADPGANEALNRLRAKESAAAEGDDGASPGQPVTEA